MNGAKTRKQSQRANDSVHRYASVSSGGLGKASVNLSETIFKAKPTVSRAKKKAASQSNSMPKSKKKKSGTPQPKIEKQTESNSEEAKPTDFGKPLNFEAKFGRFVKDPKLRLWEDQAIGLNRIRLEDMEKFATLVLSKDCQISGPENFSRINWDALLAQCRQNGLSWNKTQCAGVWKFLSLGRLGLPTSDAELDKYWGQFSSGDTDYIAADEPLSLWFPSEDSWSQSSYLYYFRKHLAQRRKLNSFQIRGVYNNRSSPDVSNVELGRPTQYSGSAIDPVGSVNRSSVKNESLNIPQGSLYSDGTFLQRNSLNSEISVEPFMPQKVSFTGEANNLRSPQCSSADVSARETIEQQLGLRTSPNQDDSSQPLSARAGKNLSRIASLSHQIHAPMLSNTASPQFFSDASPKIQEDHKGFLQWLREAKSEQVESVLNAVAGLTKGITNPAELSEKEAMVEMQVGKFYQSLELEYMALSDFERGMFRIKGNMANGTKKLPATNFLDSGNVNPS